jgi:hypothetical protein
MLECLHLSNRIWSISLCFPIWRHPNIFMNVVMWEYCTFDDEIYVDVATFTTLTLLSLLLSCKLSFPIVGLKMSYLPTLALKFPNNIFIWYLGNLLNIRSSFSQNLSFTSSILSSVVAWTFRIIWNQQPLSIMYDIQSLTNSTLLTADMILS